MRDGQLLFLALWLVYLSDCFHFLGKRDVIFVAWWGKSWIARQTSSVINLASGGVAFLNPLPPLGRFFVTQSFPLTISSKYIAAYSSQTMGKNGRSPQSGKIISLDKVNTVDVQETELWVNKEKFCNLRDCRLAEKIKDLLEALTQSPEVNRLALIESFWVYRTDSEAAGLAVDEFAQKTQFLRFLCVFAFIYFFGVIPMMAYSYGARGTIIPAAILMIAMAFLIAVEFYLVSRVLFPRRRYERVAQLVKMILCPPVAIRGCDVLMGKALTAFDPLALGMTLLSGRKQQQFIGAIVRDLAYPIPCEFEHESVQMEKICEWQNSIILRIFSQHQPETKKLVERVLEVPEKESSEVVNFCPRCHVQLSAGCVTCPDCPDVELRALKRDV